MEADSRSFPLLMYVKRLLRNFKERQVYMLIHRRHAIYNSLKNNKIQKIK